MEKPYIRMALRPTEYSCTSGANSLVACTDHLLSCAKLEDGAKQCPACDKCERRLACGLPYKIRRMIVWEILLHLPLSPCGICCIQRYIHFRSWRTRVCYEYVPPQLWLASLVILVISGTGQRCKPFISKAIQLEPYPSYQRRRNLTSS